MTKEEKLQSIIELENKLNEFQDVDILLERILSETREILNADAGSIYVVSGDDQKQLSIKYSQNDTQLAKLPAGEKLPYLSFSFPINEKSIAGYVAYTREMLNIEDCYKLSPSYPFKFNEQTDKKTGYLTKSMLTIPLITAKGTLLGVLQIINALDDNRNPIPFTKDDELYASHFASAVSQALQHAYNTQNMIKRMLKMSEFRDPKETYPHVERVSNIALEIYDRYAFDNKIPLEEQHKYRDTLKIAAKFHDIGKVGISDLILKKEYPPFNEEERNIMKGHTCLGAMLFYPSESDLDSMSIEVALHHHERYDGEERGYPGKFNLRYLVTYSDGNMIKETGHKYQIGKAVDVMCRLKKDEIPLSARIVAVADVFDALSHKRCYKEAWDVEDAFKEIKDQSGKQFDPDVVCAFLKIHDRIVSILQAIPDDED